MAVDYSKLANYSNAPSNNAVDIAKFILLNADTKRGLGGTPANNGPSIVSRIFDILSRPRYAVASTLAHGPGGFIRGLEGKDKTGFSEVLKAGGISNVGLQNALGLGLDIGLDPINFIPVGSIAKAITAARGASKLAPEVTNLQKLIRKGEPINPELFDLPSNSMGTIPSAFIKKSEVKFPKDALQAKPFTSNKTPELELPGVEPRFKLPEIISRSTIPEVAKSTGQLSLNLKLPKVSQSVEKTDVPFIHGLEFEPRHSIIADEILGKFDPAKSTAQINKAHPDTLNARQQTWLYHRAINAAKQIAKKPEWVASHANKIYAAIESNLRAQGFVPRLGSGENVSLYDVIRQMGGPSQAKPVLEHFGKNLSPDNPIWDAVQGLRAANAIDESKSVKFILDKAAESNSILQASGTLSDAGHKAVVARIAKIAKQVAKVAPISPAASDATNKLLRHVLNGGKSSAQVTVELKANAIEDILSKGYGRRAEINNSLTLALEKDLGKLPKWSVDKNNAIEFLMGRVATWWGQKDLRPLSLNAIGAASATAAARGKALNTLFKGFDLTQRAEALAVVQGFAKPTSIHTARLADELSKMMDNLIGQISGTSVVTRSALDMKMINKWLKNYGAGFTFTKGKLKDITGVEHDFSKGTDWLNSWKLAEVKGDPEVFLFKTQQAIEQATREKALFDEIGERFGQSVYGGGFRHKIDGHPYLDGYYFPEDIAKQIPRVVKDWTTPVNLSDPLMKHYDRLLSMWKSSVTIYRPAHHIRNLIGDAYLGWMDGVNTIRPYILAARVQRTLKDMYPTLQDVDKLIELGIVSKSLSTPKIGQIIFKNRSGVPFTAQQIAAVAHQKGLLEHARTIEDIIDLGESSRFRPFGGKVQAVGRSASELISHNSRLAHFIDKVIKSHGSNLETIFEQASRRARKWHPTGLDLTQFERKFLRRIIPFYAWIRKSTPLLLEGLVMNPGKSLVVPKVYGAIQQAQGIETGGIGDPFPVDQMFPEWLRAEGLGPLSTGEGFLGKFSNQQPPGYVMAGQGLDPLTQMMAQLSQPGKTLLGGLTPAIQIPLTLSSGQNLSTGQPISGPDAQPGAMQEYIGSQIPIWSMAQGITGVTPFGTTTKKGRGDQFTESAINWLTGAGIKGTGSYIKQARYEKQHPKQVERAAQKAAFLEQIRNLS